ALHPAGGQPGATLRTQLHRLSANACRTSFQSKRTLAIKGSPVWAVLRGRPPSMKRFLIEGLPRRTAHTGVPISLIHSTNDRTKRSSRPPGIETPHQVRDKRGLPEPRRPPAPIPENLPRDAQAP